MSEGMLDGTDLPIASFDHAEPLTEESASSLDPRVSELVSAGRRVLAAVRRPHGGLALEELRRARQLLAALDEALRATEIAPDVRVADDGTWFETSAGRVDVARRGAVRRLLSALAAERRRAPGQALDVHALFALGWPGETIPYESQVRRVYTAIWTLRTLGLDGVLVTRADGYLLDPKQSLAFAA